MKIEQWAERIKRPRLKARVLMLNKDRKPGEQLRGWHPVRTYSRRRFYEDIISKGEFIRRWGRERWEAMPHGLKVKDGKRRYVSRVNVEDAMWQPFMPEWHGKWTLRFDPPQAYANDPRLTVTKECRDGYEFVREFAQAV